MAELDDHPLTQFLKIGFAMFAFFIIVKSGAAYLPSSGIVGAFKKVLLMA